eukprot:g5669.t1
MGALISLPPPVALYLAVRAGRADEVKAIISQVYNGIPPAGCLEWEDELGDTALSIAVRNGDSSLVKLLLNLGSDCGHLSTQPGGASALHEAIRSVKIQSRIVESLLRNGANPFLENDYGVTPWELALSRKQTKFCRKFEQERNLFTSYLQVEMNEESREHERRWIVIIPSYTDPKQDTPSSRHLYVFPNERSVRYRLKLDLAEMKPVEVVRTQDGWKLFLVSAKTELSLVFLFSCDKVDRKVLENFLTALDPTRLLSLTPPPPKGKTIDPYKGLKSISKDRRKLHDLTDAVQAMGKAEDFPPKRYRRISNSRSITDPSRANGPCIICLENPQTAGFVHGQSIHRCVCKECALLFTKQNTQNTCPICRQEIEHVITDFY